MKTLTKILSVAALVVLCVCLFTLTAFADNPTVEEVYSGDDLGTPDCYTQGNNPGYKLSNGWIVQGTAPGAVGYELTDLELENAKSNKVSGFSALQTGYDHAASASSQTYTPAKPCAENGRTWFECDCGKHWKDAACTQEGEVLTALAAHTSGGSNPGIPATCNTDGVIPYDICSVCGQLYDATGNTITNTKIPATGDHAWSAWVVIKDPTNVSPGQQKRTCTNTGCNAVEYEEIPALGITDGDDLWYVIPVRDTWMRGEEPMTFESNLVEKLNASSGGQNWVGVRIGTDSLYENSYDTYDFWSWGPYIMLGEKTMQQLRQGEYRIWVYDRLHPEVHTVSKPFWVVDVPTLEPYSTDSHVVNSSKSLRFIASDEIDPDSIMVGSRRLYNSSDYFVSNDRMSITLSPDFLNARQTGTYTISAVTKDGRTIKTNFYILSTAQASSSPRTGDESQIGLWAAFLLLSGAAIVVMVPKLRKSRAK